MNIKEIFNDGKIQVETNGSGEIFITNLVDKQSHSLRIGNHRYDDGLQITAAGGTFTPTLFNGLGGFIVR